MSLSRTWQSRGATWTTSRINIPDFALIIEVADSSLVRDQGCKWIAYSRGGIPVYWIVNLIDNQIEVYSDPSPDGYRSSQIFKSGAEVPVITAGFEVGRIAVDRVLP
jgi:Uma2 family endonuclease